MVEPPRDAVQLMTGLLAHMRQIVGDGACYAMLHYGATEEGKRLGAGVDAGALPGVLARLDGLLQQRTEVLKDEGDVVALRVHSSALLQGSERPVHGIILGLLEGALTASRAARYRGSVVAGDGELFVELRREAGRAPE
ncbi:MAG TPA: hypothetical protein VM582_05075 [Candidatus Thermoplasmatota archaeon]|nr:hypothetical protein [Candidatus Thermoplasmatota archaeon]